MRLLKLPGRLALLLLLFAAAGCAGYRLGPTNDIVAGSKTIEIEPLLNETLELRLGDAMTTALRRQVQQDGTFHLATHGDADIVVSGRITRYIRFPVSFVPSDVLTVNDYRVSAITEIEARDLRTGRVLLERTLTNSILVQVTSDLTSAEREAMPVLAGQFGRSATSLLVDGDW